jgi:hypothetical protein
MYLAQNLSCGGGGGKLVGWVIQPIFFRVSNLVCNYRPKSVKGLYLCKKVCKIGIFH